MTNENHKMSADELQLVSGGASLVEIAIGVGISIAANILRWGEVGWCVRRGQPEGSRPVVTPALN